MASGEQATPDPSRWRGRGGEPADGTPIWVETHGYGEIGLARYDVEARCMVWLDDGEPVRPGYDAWCEAKPEEIARGKQS